MDDVFISPKPITIHEDGAHKATFVIEPLNPGYGMTLGTPLRRILLSSLIGHAISTISLPNVNHEFSTLSNVKEDMVEIILNAKLVRFRVVGNHDYPISISLAHKGEGPVTASEFAVPTGVEVVSPEVVLATVTSPDGVFEMNAQVTQGRGFSAVEGRTEEPHDIGTIAIDSIFSPVRHVALSVDNVRVGQMTNYNKVTLIVETDGSITPQQAFRSALTIFKEQVASLVLEGESFDEEASPADSADNSALEEKSETETDGTQDGSVEPSSGDDDDEGEEKAPSKRGRKKKSEKV